MRTNADLSIKRSVNSHCL